jgi:hypothetical protein
MFKLGAAMRGPSTACLGLLEPPMLLAEDPECPSDPDIQNSQAGQLFLIFPPFFSFQSVYIHWEDQ